MSGPEMVFSDIDISGDETQNAFGNKVSGDLIQQVNKFVRGRPAMYLGRSEISDRLDCHVPARNHDLVVKALRTDHAVLLTGPPGCGRETTAIAAFHELRPGISIRRFSTAAEDPEEIAAMGPRGYLIHADGEDLSQALRCADAVREAGGYAAIIGTEEQRLGLFLNSLTIDPPDPLAVYRRRLAVRGLDDAGWSHWEKATELLERALPVDARRLADLIEEIGRQGGPPETIRREVVHAYQRWADELGRWFKENHKPQDRVLLIAAAVLAPVEENSVYLVAGSLAEQLKIEVNGGGLLWSPVTGLCELLNADRDGDLITFRRHRYAESVLRRVWEDYPLARSDLLTWLAALPTDEAVSSGRSNSLVETFADLAAEHGKGRQITEAAQRWAQAGLADLAYIALSRTCLHRRVGGRIRRDLYEWAYRARTPQTLKLTIARVCELLGQTYPSIALTRLKHLSTHGNDQVAQEVIAVAMSLAADHHQEVLKAAIAWADETGSASLSAKVRRRRMRTGARIFLELAGPPSGPDLSKAPGRRETFVSFRCVPAWRAALYLDADDPAFEKAVHHWLDTALDRPDLRSQVVAIFIAAVTAPAIDLRPDPITAERIAAQTMIDIVRRWAMADPTDPSRRGIAEDIVIPLTHPWWLRLLRIMRARLRTWSETRR